MSQWLEMRRFIVALYWKSWCIWKRQAFMTLTTIFTPIICFIMLTSINNNAANSKKIEESTHPSLSKTGLLLYPLSRDIVIAFAPYSDSNVVSIMNNVQRTLENYNFTVSEIHGENEEEVTQILFDTYGNSDISEMVFGVIFDENLSYSIRQVSGSINTRFLFPSSSSSTLRQGVDFESYLNDGFVSLQIAINDAVYGLKHPKMKLSNFFLTQFPYPSYKDEKLEIVLVTFASLMTVLGCFSILPRLIVDVVQEKNAGSREWMSMAGVPRVMVVFSWLLHSMSLYFFITIVASVIICTDISGHSVFNPSNIFFIWLLLFLFCTCSVLFVLAATSFIDNVNLAVIFGSLVWILPFVVTISYQSFSDMSYTVKIISSFFPSCSVYWAFAAIKIYEINCEPITVSNVFMSGEKTGQNEISLGGALLSLFCTSFLYSLIFLYFDLIKPGKFGFARPWHYPLSAICKLFYSKVNTGDCNVDIKRKKNFEHVSDESVGLSFQGIIKRFDHVVAVDNVTIDVLEGQITALLGHNGAGKTTLLKIISGITSPTKGKIFKNGKNVFEDFKNFCKNVGFCPQNNVLFPCLSVVEHVTLFGMFRGMPKSQAITKAKDLLFQFGLLDEMDSLTTKLSEEMKRTLSLCISLIGDPQILLLDEPTSGMDPETRRMTWSKLMKLRENCTIILATNSLEEAVLGNMIAIMDHGIIKCYGTLMFLKRIYGHGYKITVPNQYQVSVESIVKTFIPSASAQIASGPYVSFSIPLDEIEVFIQLISSVENQLPPEVRIGVSFTTLDDVFLAASKEGADETNDDKEVISGDSKENLKEPIGQEGLTIYSSTKFELVKMRFLALFTKKKLYLINYWPIWLILGIFFPLVVFSIVLSLTSAFLHGQMAAPSLAMDLNIYGETEVLCTSSHNNLSMPLYRNFKAYIEKQGSQILEMKNSNSLEEDLLHVGRENLWKYRYSYVIAANLSGESPNLFFSSIATHSPAIAINTLYKIFFSTDDIQTYNHPYSFDVDICYNRQYMKDVFPLISVAEWVFSLPLVLAVIAFSLSSLHHSERLNGGKLLQLMSGTSPIIYWTSAFLCDFCLFFIIAPLMLCWICIFDTAAYFSSADDYGVLLLILLLSFSGNTWFGYVTSYLFKSYFKLLAVNIFIAVLVGQAACFIISIYMLTNPEGIIKAFLNLLLFYPTYCSSAMIVKFIRNLSQYAYEAKCSNHSDEILNRPSIFTWENDGINLELTFMICDCFLLAFLIFLADYRLFRKITNHLFNLFTGRIDQSGLSLDLDVKKEKGKVETIISSHERSSYIIVDSLGKKYSRKVVAVNNISFLVPKGQCFGLLGVNGAGKSTTFKMLTGDLLPSAGQAILFGKYLTDNKLKTHIGYCPQSDALIESLTGSQMLKLYASLHGINSTALNRSIYPWISEFDLQAVSDNKCETYSKGVKRILNVAISLIGEPQVLFLDEPTTGVDPVARRKFWAILEKLKKKGCTIILTSNSMDECELLCDRLAIMVKGEIKCIGSIQSLKDIYGPGYTIIIHLVPNSKEKKNLCNSVKDSFYPHAILRERQNNFLHYHINSPDYKLSALFTTMENIKKNNSCLQEYIISETTLEQIFLHFAKT